MSSREVYMRLISLAVLGMLTFHPLPSQGDDTSPGKRKARFARVRVVHNFATTAVPQPASVDVRVGADTDPAGNPVAATLDFGDVTDYLKLKPGTYAVGVYAAGTTTALLTTSLTLERGRVLTIVARQVGTADPAFTVEPLDDSARRPRRPKASVRVVHGIPAGAADDVKIGAAGVGCLTPAVSYPAQAVLEVQKGTYTLGVYPPSDPDCSGEPIAGLSATATIKAKRTYTAIARFKPGVAEGFELALVEDEF
jgi:Domain of unknown function (DUF4397)